MRIVLVLQGRLLANVQEAYELSNFVLMKQCTRTDFLTGLRAAQATVCQGQFLTQGSRAGQLCARGRALANLILPDLCGCLLNSLHKAHCSLVLSPNLLTYVPLCPWCTTGTRIAGIMGSKKVLIMQNHGILIATETIAEGFDYMYYLERTAMVTLKALNSTRPLKPIREEVCQMTHEKFVLSGVAKVGRHRPNAGIRRSFAFDRLWSSLVKCCQVLSSAASIQ